MLKNINSIMEKMLPFLTPSSVVIGIVFSTIFDDFSQLVPWIFAFITFAGSLNLSFHAFKQALLHPLPIFVVLLLLHLFIPLWAFAVGHLAFQEDSFTIIGLVLAVIIPTGVTSFIWVSIHKGNLALALAVILIDTFISPFVVPASLLVLVERTVEIDVWNMMSGLFFMIILPSILGMLVNEWTKKELKQCIAAVLSPFSKIALSLVVIINSAVVAPYLANPNKKLILIGFFVFLIAASGYFFSWMTGHLLKFQQGDIITLTFTGGMRNISAGAVLAITYFPPQVAVPVVLGMLFQQVLASFYGRMLEKVYHHALTEKKYAANAK
mgnify:FL=1